MFTISDLTAAHVLTAACHYDDAAQRFVDIRPESPTWHPDEGRDSFALVDSQGGHIGRVYPNCTGGGWGAQLGVCRVGPLASERASVRLRHDFARREDAMAWVETFAA